MILAIDQGTTATTCLVVSPDLVVLGRGYREISQSFPEPGWVEHDPEEIWASVGAAAEAAVRAAAIDPGDLTAIGLTNQRETAVLWERRSGRPLRPAIVWQDRRTSERCRELPADLIRARTGLVCDPYFSASKLEWMLARCDHPLSDTAFGTVDSWLVWKLTGGGVHATDATNASRTMLFGLEADDWDGELLELFGVPPEILPRVVASSGIVAETDFLGVRLPIAGIAGDQQAALFGQCCFAPDQAKATYGTGSFVLVNRGGEAGPVPDGLLATRAAVAPSAPRQYALEGAVLASGAAVQWLRDGLGLIETAAETESLARSVASSEGVHFVPALTGLGSPYWDADARGLVSGLTRGTTRAHLVRAGLEAIAFQVADVVDALPPLQVLRADGGATANRFLMQFQADVLGCPVEVAAEADTTALGAAALAGLGSGVFAGPEEVAALLRPAVRYEPAMAPDEVTERRQAWRLAVRRALLR